MAHNKKLSQICKAWCAQIRSLTADKDVALCHDLFEFNPDDARLMAAAPELLAALEKLASTLDSLSLSDEEAWTSDLKAARAAIAKAKGA